MFIYLDNVKKKKRTTLYIKKYEALVLFLSMKSAKMNRFESEFDSAQIFVLAKQRFGVNAMKNAMEDFYPVNEI